VDDLFQDKKVALGVTGGIAAYKGRGGIARSAAARLYRSRGHD
jgi:phosphopantothenoylcysteine synthetase/decarboxylase